MNPELEQTILAQNIHGLDEIEAGHWVYVGCGCSRHAGDYLLKKVDRITKTQIIISDRRFNRVNGGEIGSRAYHAESIIIPTPELILQVKVVNAKRNLRLMAEQVERAIGIKTGTKIISEAGLRSLESAHNQLQAVLATLEGGK